MRLIKEVPHAEYKISIYSWNNKYIIKIESGMIEQTYKVSEWDLTGEDDLPTLIDELFVQKIDDLFDTMNQKLQATLASI